MLHGGDGGQGNESNNQGVFDHILAFFVVLQFLELQIEFEENGVHRCVSVG
jgi:hypothetical protein